MPERDRTVAEVSWPSFHATSTSKPPRARRPRTVPVCQAFGSAGSSSSTKLAVGRGFLALQQHFGHRRAAAEIAVDLERRMETEQVRRAAANQHGEELFGAVAVMQAGPEIGLPGHAPAGGGIAAPFQRKSGASVEFGRAGVDFTAGAQAPQMRAVAVMDFGLLKILLPFHDASLGVHAGGREPGAGGVEAPGELLVDPQDARGGRGVLQQVAGDLLVEGGAHAQRGRLPLAVLVLCRRSCSPASWRARPPVRGSCGFSTSTACMNWLAPRRTG